MAYIQGDKGTGAPDECLFCGLSKQDPSSGNLVLETYEHGFLVLNAFPYTSGHVMVAPYRHDDSLLGVGPEARAEILAAVERVRRALAREYKAEGFNVGVNLGRVAGAGVIGHLHWHLVPRWLGDTNFVPALAATRVMPEALPDTYARILRALETESTEGVTLKGRGRVP
jgi:ATP adenylyltransferase